MAPDQSHKSLHGHALSRGDGQDLRRVPLLDLQPSQDGSGDRLANASGELMEKLNLTGNYARLRLCRLPSARPDWLRAVGILTKGSRTTAGYLSSAGQHEDAPTPVSLRLRTLLQAVA